MRKGLPPEHFLRIAEGVITPEQLLDLNANPFVLLDTGYGVVEVISLTLKLAFVETAYDTGSGLSVEYGSDGTAIITDFEADLMDAEADAVKILTPDAVSTLVDGNANQIVLTAGTDFKSGDSPLHYRLAYRVHNI